MCGPFGTLIFRPGTLVLLLCQAGQACCCRISALPLARRWSRQAHSRSGLRHTTPLQGSLLPGARLRRSWVYCWALVQAGLIALTRCRPCLAGSLAWNPQSISRANARTRDLALATSTTPEVLSSGRRHTLLFDIRLWQHQCQALRYGTQVVTPEEALCVRVHLYRNG